MKALAMGGAFLSLFGMTAACSQSDPAVTVDAATDAAADAASDADAAGPTCDLDAPFGHATLVDYRSSADAGSIPLSGVLRLDAKAERFGIFDAVQGPSTKIFFAGRVGDGLVGADERVASASVVRASPALSSDGKVLYFSAVVAGKSAIYRSGSDVTDFAAAALWLGSAQANMVMPYVANDAALYFVDGTGPMRVAIDGTGKAGAPAAVGGVPATATAVAVNEAESVLYYGEGNSFDTAATHEMRWSGSTWVAKDVQPLVIDGLQKVETPTWLSPDGCRLYVLGWESVVDRALYLAVKPKK